MADDKPMIEVGITASIDQLQKALQKAEGQVKSSSDKMAKQAEAASAKLEAKLAQQAAAITKVSVKRIASLEDQLDDAREKTQQQAAQFAQKLEAAAAQSKKQVAALKDEMDKFRIVNEAFRNDAAKPMPQQVFTSGQKPAEEAGSSAGGSFTRGLQNALLRGTGALAIANVLADSFSKASETFRDGGSAKEVAGAFANGFVDAFKSVPVVGPLTTALENFTEGAFDRLQQSLADKGNQAANAYIDRFQERLDAGTVDRTAALKQQAQDIAADRFTEQLAMESPGLARDRKLEIETLRAIRPLLEEQKKLKDEIFHLEAEASTLTGTAEGAVRRRLKEIQDEHDARAQVIKQMQLATKEQVKYNEVRDNGEIDAADLKYKEEEAKKAADAAAVAAKAKSESEIKALEQTGKARESAIAAQIAALQGQSPAARAASIGALTQQFAGNMGGSIQTALGTFRSGGAAVAERAFQEAKAQTEKQERIVKLQEEMKQVQVDIRTKIDAMKGAT